MADKGSGRDQLDGPVGIVVDRAGRVGVADAINNRIAVFGTDGSYQGSFGALGSGNGRFDEPLDVAVSSAGLIYVTDWYNRRVAAFALR